MQILRTKLYRPSLPGDLILRSHLIDMLSRGLDRPLTLVSAPAGYGKTILVSSWLDACPLPSAWVSLDENDNDLRVFLGYLAGGIRSMFPGSLQRTQVLPAGPSLPSVPVLADSLINELDELERDFILVLDDLHSIHEQDIYDLLAALLRHPPKNMRLVLVTRRDPPLPLGSLRAHDQVTDVRAQELRFSAEEMAAFVDQATGAPLRDEALAVLAERTEGWAAGLRLAALTLRYAGDLDRHVAELHAENRYVMDYFLNEVLAHVPPEMEDFLVRTSILDWLCGPLCDAVRGSNGGARSGQADLEWLEQANIFTVSLDEQGHWYRYHSLFRRLLSKRLERQLSPDEIAALHVRASAWFASEGSIEKALEHALAGHDTLGAVQLVAQHRHDLLNTEQRPRLERWLRMFSDAALAQHADLVLARAWVAELRRAESQTVHEMLEQAQALVDRMEEQARARQLQGEIDVLVSLERSFAADDPQCIIGLATRALAVLPQEWYLVRAEAWFYLALAYQMTGQIDRSYAVHAFAQREDMAVDGAPRVRILGSIGFVYWIAADLSSLLEVLRRTVSIAQAANLFESLGWSHHYLAVAHYQRNELALAEQHANAVHELRYASHRIAVVQNAMVLASIRQARGQPGEARQALDEAQDYLQETRSQALLPLVQAFAAELAAMQGDLDTAGRWATTVGPHVPFDLMAFFYAPQLTLPKVLLAINTPASRQQAAEALARLHAFVISTHNTRFSIDVLALQALLHDAEGDELAALQALQQALLLAQPGGFIRVFADLGPRMAYLLDRLAKRGVAAGYIAQILQACSNPPPLPSAVVGSSRPSRNRIGEAGLIERLTRRELEVLELLALRFSDKEIAQRLVISDRTVKRHTANIYQKMGVSSRRDAAAAAIALGILATR